MINLLGSIVQNFHIRPPDGAVHQRCEFWLYCWPNLHFSSAAQQLSHTPEESGGSSRAAASAVTHLSHRWRLSLCRDHAAVRSRGKPPSGACKRAKPEASVCASAETLVKRTKWCCKRSAARVCLGFLKCHPAGQIEGSRRSLNTPSAVGRKLNTHLAPTPEPDRKWTAQTEQRLGRSQEQTAFLFLSLSLSHTRKANSACSGSLKHQCSRGMKSWGVMWLILLLFLSLLMSVYATRWTAVALFQPWHSPVKKLCLDLSNIFRDWHYKSLFDHMVQTEVGFSYIFF